MTLTYVHLSDLHFGQERGSDIYVHDDVKERLIDDVSAYKSMAEIERMDGVIVTGDIAFSGKKAEYDRAANWLDRLTETIGCEQTDVIVVPGNHDIDRQLITRAASLILGHLHEHGNKELEDFLDDPLAMEMLYHKFSDYRNFAEGYSCPLHSDGGVAVDRSVPVAPGRNLRFVGLNSALLCTGHKIDEGKLLIGGKQRVLQRSDGCELVVLCHHPLESLQDGHLVAPYIRSRARVHVYGHNHEASVSKDESLGGADLLTVSAGAVLSLDKEKRNRYTYNLLSFGWDSETEHLKVGIARRSWDERATHFVADNSQFKDGHGFFDFRCPNSRSQASFAAVHMTSRDFTDEATRASGGPLHIGGNAMQHNRDLLRLHFFRDLNAEQRKKVLVKVGLLTKNWDNGLTHTLERRLFDRALGSGLEADLGTAVSALRTAVAIDNGSEDE